MAWTTASDPHLIPYTQASSAQLSQAIITAREALDLYYPNLTWTQWHHAFETVEPLLKSEAGQVTPTFKGLSELVRHFEALAPASDSVVIASDLPTQGTQAHQKAKKTYSIELNVLESLDRLSYWQRKDKSTLVNLALSQLLAQYPESQIPIPIN